MAAKSLKFEVTLCVQNPNYTPRPHPLLYALGCTARENAGPIWSRDSTRPCNVAPWHVVSESVAAEPLEFELCLGWRGREHAYRGLGCPAILRGGGPELAGLATQLGKTASRPRRGSKYLSELAQVRTDRVRWSTAVICLDVPSLRSA